MIEATPLQRADALKRGREILAPYGADTVPGQEIFEVPTASKVGVMIFDGASDSLESNNVYLLARRPSRLTWIELDGKRGFWIGQAIGKR